MKRNEWAHFVHPETCAIIAMTIISRYITRQIGKYFILILVIVLGIYVTVDFIDKIDNFMEAGVSLRRTVVYFVFQLPLIIEQVTPLGILLAVLITFGLMAKNNELTALRSCGVSLAALTGPIFRSGVGAMVFMILLAEGVAPLTVNHANRIWLRDVMDKQITTTRQNDIWLKSDSHILHISLYDPETRTINGVTRYTFDRQFQLVERLDALKGIYQGHSWQTAQVVIQRRDDRSNRMAMHFLPDYRVNLDFTPENLSSAVPQTEEMSFIQLYRYIQRVEAEGYDAARYRVDLYAKTARPFFCIVLTLIGAGLAARGKIRDGLAISVTYGLGIAFAYWIVFSFCMSLGYAGILPPFVAAWGVNFISLCMAGFLLINAD
ncbi:MAG: LPS export ABC transporter permease LptG [Desulfatitalea sp.]|nr:LPS export ABC transporter permease LptG [Desulfatitalea sp.]NNK00896.1 LPS export ABC transporter permease LptG [Desulfatitalea sp.]